MFSKRSDLTLLPAATANIPRRLPSLTFCWMAEERTAFDLHLCFNLSTRHQHAGDQKVELEYVPIVHTDRVFYMRRMHGVKSTRNEFLSHQPRQRSRPSPPPQYSALPTSPSHAFSAWRQPCVGRCTRCHLLLPSPPSLRPASPMPVAIAPEKHSVGAHPCVHGRWTSVFLAWFSTNRAPLFRLAVHR